MYEVEVKVRAKHEPVRTALRELGADELGTVTQVDTYYDHPGRSFSETDEALRLRQETNDSTDIALTYKGPLVDDESKTREEHEIHIDDNAAAEAILKSVGFDPVATVRKTRERYASGDFTITLDHVESLGEFVEVETTGPESAIPALRDEAYAIVRDLGLEPENQLRRSYLELLLD